MRKKQLIELQETETDVKVADFCERLSLDVIHSCASGSMHIATFNISRPGLQLAGYYKHFSNERVQVIGEQEMSYLLNMTPEKRAKACDKLCQHDFPCLIITSVTAPPDELVSAVKKYDRNCFHSAIRATAFINEASIYFNELLAPEITIHGVLMDLYGVGVLIVGHSGVGKSETAIELIQRGHRLVADDAVNIKRISDRLVGASPEGIRYLMEMRGIGIIDVRAMYGTGSVRQNKVIDLVAELEPWDDKKEYDRLGDETHTYNILGADLPKYVIPVKPARNLSVILEVVARTHRLKSMGYNPLDELLSRVTNGSRE